MEEVKFDLSNGGAEQVRLVVNSAERNDFGGARTSLNRRIDGFTASQGVIAGYKFELVNYINASSSCSATAIFNPITGNYRLGG